MSWNAFDLHLLVVFNVVAQEKNFTRAGQRLGLSQPAISHALTRLRHVLKDELFVRSPTGMMPTPRAEQLATPIFHIAVDNYAAIVLVAPIATHIARIAPGVTLDFRPSGTLDVLDMLDR